MPASIYVLCFTNIRLFGVGLGLGFDVLYLLSMLNLLRLIYKCAYTEPGIVPAIPSPGLNAENTPSKEFT